MGLGITVEFNAEMVKFSQQLDKIGGQMDRFRASAERTSADIGAALSKIGGGIAFGALAADILATNRAMESLRTQMESVTGSAEGGARAFDFVKKFAVETPFAIEGLSKSFVTLKNMGITPTAEVMTALTNQASKLGASQETLEAIVLQLGQAYSKGKLQQEDMVILAERGVPIYELAAQALNKTGNEIAEMSKKGEMGRDAIDAIIKKMGELSEGSNARAMDTLNGKISQLSDAWVNFQDTLLNDKSEGLIKSFVSNATSALSQLTQVLSSDLDAQIATLEQKLAYRDFGVIGKTVYSLTNPVDAQQDMRGQDANDRELKRLKALKVERDKLSRDAEISQNSQSAIKQTQGWLDEMEQSSKKVEKSSATAVKHVSSVKSEVSALQKEYESLTETLQKQIALHGDNSAAAEMEYAVQFSALSKLDDAQKIRLLNLAAEKDFLGQNTQRQQAMWDQLISDANEFVDVTKSIQDFAAGDISLTGFNGLLGRIKDDLDAGIISAEQAKQKFDELGKAFNDGFVEPAKAGSDELSQFGVQAARNIQSSFADFIMSAGEGFDDLGANFAKTLARMAADAASAKLMESLLGKGFGTDSATGDGLLQAGLSGLGSLFGGMFGFANGGIMTPSGPLPLRAYAGGGIANSPQLALFGEGRMNEAFVPLPDGRSIPVTMNGGGVTVNVINNAAGYEATTRERKTAQGREIDVIIDQKIRKAMADEKRQGGMLA